MRKSQLQIIDGSLFLYGSIVTFFLTIAGFLNLNNTISIVSLVLFLPVSLYFLIKVFFSVKQLLLSFLNLDHNKHPQSERFTFANFIHQSETSFLINIGLLCFAVALILFRISLQIIK